MQRSKESYTEPQGDGLLDEKDLEVGAQHSKLSGASKECVILLVDDNAIIRRTLRHILDIDFQTIAVASGAEALEVARDPTQRIDVLLTDVQMPEMSGAELGIQMALLRPKVPRIYMSGAVGAVVLETGATLLRKPFALDSLVSFLKLSARVS